LKSIVLVDSKTKLKNNIEQDDTSNKIRNFGFWRPTEPENWRFFWNWGYLRKSKVWKSGSGKPEFVQKRKMFRNDSKGIDDVDETISRNDSKWIDDVEETIFSHKNKEVI